jgi:hypothetical protein
MKFCLTVVTAVVTASGSFAAPQSSTAYVAPRTADGQPDLQGTWTNATVTPFERPKEFAGKKFLTEQEAKQVEDRAAANREKLERHANQEEVGNYNQLWRDPGTTVAKTRRTSLVVDPPDGRVHIKPEALAKRAKSWSREKPSDSYEDMDTWQRCITRGIPGSMIPTGYNNGYMIVQIPGYVMIFYEMIHDPRVIPLDGRAHLPSTVTSFDGDPRGHWEGNTLVVDTTNFNGKGWLASPDAIKGLPLSPAMHVVERFTRVDADTINYKVTVTDPNIYLQPWTAIVPLTRDPNYQLFEYACHEGNLALEDILKVSHGAEKK